MGSGIIQLEVLFVDVWSARVMTRDLIYLNRMNGMKREAINMEVLWGRNTKE